MVIDGVGGQAAGEKAAEAALRQMRARLERETGAPEERLREAITLANNEVFRLAQSQPEWTGMACVLTVAMCATAGWWSATSATPGSTSSATGACRR